MKRDILELCRSLVYPANIYCICCGIPIEKTELYSLCHACRIQMLEKKMNKCVICGRFFSGKGKDVLCMDCSAKEPSFSKGITCTIYDDQVKKMIYNFKYGGKSYLKEPLGQIMWSQIEQSVGFDVVISVPMHPKKKKARGYNQAELIALEIAALSGKEFCKDCLIRTKNTIPMSGLTIEERTRNIKDVFYVNKPRTVEGKSVVLVDDIYTTGSTTGECGRMLFMAGAKKVYVLTFAATLCEGFEKNS